VIKNNIAKGKIGEELAAGFLKKHGYKILFSNYRNRFGEIDIIARNKNVICFVEVKCRSNIDFGLPQESVGDKKQKKLGLLGAEFLKAYNFLDCSARFDVVSVLLSKDGLAPEIELFKNAFDAKE